MKVSLEHIYHYRCDRCDKWWSIADVQPTIGAISHCPHCGHKNVVEKIQSHQNGSEQLLLPVVGHKCTTTHSACHCVLEQLKDRISDLNFEYNQCIAAEEKIERLEAENIDLRSSLLQGKLC